MDVRLNNDALKELNDCIGGLLHLGLNFITFRTLLHLGPNFITFRTVITFRPSTHHYLTKVKSKSNHAGFWKNPQVILTVN